MAEEFEGRDLSEATFWGVDLSRATFRDVNLTGVSISHAWLVDVAIDGLVDRVLINGIDVTHFVNARDPWHPLRAMLRPDDQPGLRAGWDALQQRWSKAVADAGQHTEAQLHESVDGQWSFVQTLRHLVFVMDKWFFAPVLGEAEFHPIGMSNTGSIDFGWPGIDRAASPTFDEVLAVRAERVARFRDYLDAVTPAELTREVEVLENGTAPVQECLFTVFEEEFEHLRYAVRDLASL